MRLSVSSNSTRDIIGNSTLCLYGTFLLQHLQPSSNLFSLQATMKNVYYSFSVGGGDGVCQEPVTLAAVPQNIQPAVVSGSCWRWAPGGQAWVSAWLCQGSPAQVYLCAGLYTLTIVPFTLAGPNAVPRDAWPCPALRHQDSMQEWGYRGAASRPRRSGQEPLHCLSACRREGWYPQGEMGWAGGTGLAWAALLPLLFSCLMQSEQKPGKSKITPCSSAV